MTPIFVTCDSVARDMLGPEVAAIMEAPLPPGNDCCTYYAPNSTYQGQTYHLFATCHQHHPVPTENGYGIMLIPATQMSKEDFLTTIVNPWLAQGKNVIHRHIDHYHTPAQ
jgi:hypothetical protein